MRGHCNSTKYFFLGLFYVGYKIYMDSAAIAALEWISQGYHHNWVFNVFISFSF